MVSSIPSSHREIEQARRLRALRAVRATAGVALAGHLRPGERHADEHELLNRLDRLSAARTPMSMDRVIGCIAITQPVFFTPDWIAAPTDWARSIVSGRGYDLTSSRRIATT